MISCPAWPRILAVRMAIMITKRLCCNAFAFTVSSDGLTSLSWNTTAPHDMGASAAQSKKQSKLRYNATPFPKASNKKGSLHFLNPPLSGQVSVPRAFPWAHGNVRGHHAHHASKGTETDHLVRARRNPGTSKGKGA